MKPSKASRHYNNVLWEDKPRNFLGLALNFTRYILTEDKLITRSGMLNIHEDEIQLYRVVDKSVKLSFGDRIFGCGSIVLHVRDSDTSEKILQSIKLPRKISLLLDQVVDNAKAKYGTHGTEMYGAMSSAGTNGHMHVIDADHDGTPDILQRK